jgi:hypothetical protein
MFKFELGQKVKLSLSGEEGFVTGRAQYEASENSYYVRYVNADGRQVECWWGEKALEAA